MVFIFLLAITYFDSTEARESTGFIEQCIYLGSGDGTPMNYPGVIFRLYLDGTLYINKIKTFKDSEDEFRLYKIDNRDVDRIVKSLEKYSRKANMKAINNDSKIKISVIQEKNPSFYTYEHGAYSSIRLKKGNFDRYIVYPWVPAKGYFDKLTKKIQKIAKKYPAQPLVPLPEDELFSFPIVMLAYFEAFD